jgi:hypothetical protein
MLDGVLHGTVVNAVPIPAFNSLPPVIGVTVDLLRRWKWWLARGSRFFPFYRYAELR